MLDKNQIQAIFILRVVNQQRQLAINTVFVQRTAKNVQCSGNPKCFSKGMRSIDAGQQMTHWDQLPRLTLVSRQRLPMNSVWTIILLFEGKVKRLGNWVSCKVWVCWCV